MFQGVALPEREEDQKLKTLSADTPDIPEPTKERRGLNVSGMRKSPTPILASDGHWGDSPIIQDLEAKGGTNSAPLDHTNKASSLSAEGFHPTQTLLASTDVGTCMATNSATQLCGSDGLPADTRASGGDP